MSDPTHDTQKSEEFQGISSLHVSRLLELGFSREREPIDGLITRLRGPDGAVWLRDALLTGRLGPASDLEALATPAGASISVLRSIKDRANALLKDPKDSAALHAGMAGYFLAIAASLGQHGQMLTQQPREKIEPILRKLSNAASEPWASVFRRALESPKTKSQGGD